jgi:hypothetical protein
MKQCATALVALSGALTAMTFAVQAEAASQTTYYNTRIVLNGSVVSQPKHIVAVDPWSNIQTSFVPVWYVNQALARLSIQVTWDGRVLNFVLPQGMSADLSHPASPVPINARTLGIAINGTIVGYAPRQVARDPAGGQQTTYVPVYYLQQALKRVGITATWDGTTWAMTSSFAAPQATKLQTALDFAKVLHIQGDASGTNPYSDVPTADWPIIHALVEKGYFAADSDSTFGANDAVPISSVEHAYQLYCGIPDNHMAWNPGGNLSAWANAIQLTQGLTSTSGNLSPLDEQRMMTNLGYLYQGYSRDANGVYHLWAQPWDAYPIYAVSPQPPGVGPNDASFIAQSLAWAYQYIDNCSITQDGTTTVWRVPGLSENDAHVAAVGFYTAQHDYSLDGGRTWKQSTDPDNWFSVDPNAGATSSPPAFVLARGNGPSGVSVAIIHDQELVDLVSTTWVTVDNNADLHVKYYSGYGNMPQ